ncbi:hypothetical protein C5Y96_17765 [Blastopirellula marina]|uniref:Uncharacterized protein n=1 Tax=Blastopirellula marina TaxID=124 RepID=A0A2S8F5F3_9BACT|nr:MULTISPECIES: hypothetical protein [Pirellulaceae]PQO27388.1 hypothetical protein C5Y96_17765 [Blastopirellula marina]RCS47925.1 hypothetical protein DTL36_17790 [Bremerella cremea]
MSELFYETKVRWLHEPARQWAWVRCLTVDTEMQVTPTTWHGSQIVAFSISRAYEVHGVYTPQKVSRILYRNVMQPRPEGCEVDDIPEDAVFPRLDVGIGAMHPSRYPKRIPTDDVCQQSQFYHDTFQKFWQMSDIIHAEPGPKRRAHASDILHHVAEQETEIVWLLPEFKRATWLHETASGTHTEFTPNSFPGRLLVAYSRTDYGRCRIWTLPKGMTGLEESVPAPGWWCVHPLSIRAGRPSESPRKRWHPIDRSTRKTLSQAIQNEH